MAMNKIRKVDSSASPAQARAFSGPATVGIEYDAAAGKGLTITVDNTPTRLTVLAASAAGVVTDVSGTYTDATLAASVVLNQFRVKTTLTPATAVTGANGVNSIRGELALTAAKTITSGYFAGVYGRVNIGAGATVSGTALAAVYGKIDFGSTSTIAGNVAPVQSNIVNPPVDGSNISLFYGESAGGNPVNSMFRAFGKATYVFDIATNTHTQASTTGTPGSVTGGTGWLKVLVEGVVRYIPLASSVS